MLIASIMCPFVYRLPRGRWLAVSVLLHRRREVGSPATGGRDMPSPSQVSLPLGLAPKRRGRHGGLFLPARRLADELPQANVLARLLPGGGVLLAERRHEDVPLAGAAGVVDDADQPVGRLLPVGVRHAGP